MKKVIVFMCLLLFGLMAGNASATFYTDESFFIAANPGMTTIDFEGIAAPGTATDPVATLTLGAVTFSGDNLRVADKDFNSGDVYGQPSDMLFSDLYGADVSMTFLPNVEAIGFLLSPGHNTSDVTISLYDGLNNLLDSQTVLANNMNIFDTFVGWDNLGAVDNLLISITGFPQYLCLDNVRYAAVPEPATMLLLGTGLIGLAAFRRKFRT